MENSVKYFDYLGKELPNHDGTMLEIDDVGYQFFDINGKGFIHDGSMMELPDGRLQFFLHNGKAIIGDGSPVELPDGNMQYFDHEGIPLWPINEKKITPLFTEQRNVFFEDRINHINKQTPLEKNQIEELRLALLAAEHPEYVQKSIQNANIQEGKKIKLEALCEETAGYLILLKGFWWQIWKDFQLRHRETLSARYTLERYKNTGCHLAKASLAESVLEDELKREFKKADKDINPPLSFNEIEKIGTNKNGIFVLDERLINYSNNNGKGEGTVEFLRQVKEAYQDSNFDLESRKQAWRHPLFMYRCVANIVWLNKVKKRIESLQRKPPALTYVVHEHAHKPMRRGTVYDKETGKLVDYKGQELAVIEDFKNIPSMDMETIQNILSPANIKVLSTINAHRLLRWEVQTVTKQFVENNTDARALKVIGGYQELAQRIGAGNSSRVADQLRDIIVWQAAPRFYGSDGRCGNMLSFDYTPSGKSRKAVLNLVMGNMMLPHYVFELMGMSKSSREERRLIPIVDMPPLIGRDNDQGAQASFQMEILVEIRKGAIELVNNGGVTITKERLRELAERAGLSHKLSLKVIDRWVQDGTDAPAFLKLIEDDCYALGDNFKKAQEFLIQAGKKEIRGRQAGKLSRAKKNRSIL